MSQSVCGFEVGSKVRFENECGREVVGVVVGKSPMSTAELSIKVGDYTYTVNNVLVKKDIPSDKMSATPHKLSGDAMVEAESMAKNYNRIAVGGEWEPIIRRHPKLDAWVAGIQFVGDGK